MTEQPNGARAKKAGASLLVAAVLGGAGVAIALVLSGEAAAVDDKTVFCSEFVSNMEASSAYSKWSGQNPGERDKWNVFSDAICASQSPAVPVVATAFGKALLAAGKMALPEEPPPTTTTSTSTTTTTTTTTEPEPPPAGCTDTQQAGQSAQAFTDSLSAGDVGCFVEGTYSTPSFDTGGFTVRGAPGASVLLRGSMTVYNTADDLTISHLKIEGLGSANVVKVYASNFTLSDSDVTNLDRNYSCFILGSSSAGAAPSVKILRNRIHNCGDNTDASKDHGIYSSNASDGEIAYNVFYEVQWRCIQLYPNSDRMLVHHNTCDGANAGGAAMVATSDSDNNVFEFNVIADPAMHAVDGDSGSTGNIARNNCFSGSEPSSGWLQSDIIDGGGNLIVADPLFVNRAARDYSLQSGSPCIGKGA